jgi:adenylate cyclase
MNSETFATRGLAPGFVSCAILSPNVEGPPVLIRVTPPNERPAEFRSAGPFVVGRQALDKDEPAPIVFLSESSPARLIVAAHAEKTVPRRALRFDPISPTRVKVANLSRVAFTLRADDDPLAPGATVERDLPLDFSLGAVVLSVAAETDWAQLELPTAGPEALADRRSVPTLPVVPADQQEVLVRWMQTTAAVFQRTLSTSEFIAAAAAALVDLVGLDEGRVYLLRDGIWQEAARFPDRDDEVVPSRTVLERVRTERRTFWKRDDRDEAGSTILRQLSMVVAAPVLDATGDVVGVLYGDKRIRPGLAARTIGKPEALLVEMLACGVATGLSRQKQEDVASKAEARFAQFFSQDLAERLTADPSLLDAREAEVSLLFADVRGFSRISERIGPAESVRWIGEIMTELSREVLNTAGVVIDYVGDEIVAMWGAPAHQPDHAERAVRAGLAMLEALPALNERWRPRTREGCQIGVGVNSGLALVGNIGSQMKFKYGALGKVVNVASRVQGLTKFLKRPFLVSGETRERLGPKFIARRVCKARVVNIGTPLDVFEVERISLPARREFFAASEAALTALETKRFAEAARMAGTLLGTHQGDGPLQLILSRAAAMLMDDGTEFDPVWTPPGK